MKQIIEHQEHVRLELAKDGLQEVELVACVNQAVHIQVDKHRHAQMLLTYTGESTALHLTIELQSGSSLQLLCWNEVKDSLNSEIVICGDRDARLHMGIGDVSDAKSSYQIKSDLNHEGMDIHLTTVCLASQKNWWIELCHTCGHTHGRMENFAVVQEDGAYTVEAAGRICHGAKESASHQTTRVLTLSEKQVSEVLPILYIDENDVKASHATTVGQPDEGQLYYLQSRGLSRTAALGLLTMGYLMPITEVIQDETIRQGLQKQIEEKVIIHA